MNKVKVLIVEDEVLISEYLSRHLNNAGIKVTEIVDSGEKALISVHNNVPDIVIMDIELAGKLDGIQTTKQIYKTNILPVIYLTKLSDKATFKKAKLTNPASYLSKPFNQFDIINAIELALYNSSCVQEKKDTKQSRSDNPIYLVNNMIFVKDSKNLFIKVAIKDIVFIKAEGSYSSIKTIDDLLMTSYTLKAINDKIQHPELIRIHRSFMVNVNRIVTIIGKKSVILNVENLEKPDNSLGESNTKKQELQIEIPIGEDFRESFYNKLKVI